MIDRKKVEEALGPVWGWYQSDEHEDRPLEDILRQRDRNVVLGIIGPLSTIMLRIQEGRATKGDLEQFCRDAWEISR
jgi:hypothetical protein